MRRKDREIVDEQFIEKVLNDSVYGALGLCDDGAPYVVPMNFAWSENKIWLHCATEGRKLEIIRANPKVCFQVSAETEMVTADNPCGYGMYYSSVMIFGIASIIEVHEEKSKALGKIMQHYSENVTHQFTQEETQRVTVISITPDKITCKARLKQGR